MARMTVDINEEWLDAARQELGTGTKVATINEALRSFAVRRQAAEILAALDGVPIDFTGSDQAWGHNGGRDLSKLAEDAHASDLP